MSVEFDASRLLAKLGPQLYAPAVRQLIARLALTTERAAKAQAPTDMGALRRSIVSDLRPTSAKVYTPLHYAASVEYGRRPGSMPPPQALIGWMRRHRMDGSPWALARSIARRGIKGRFFMRAGLKAATDALPNLTALAARKVEQDWRTK